MDITGERILTLPRDRVWAGLMDARVLQAAVPGAQSITANGGGAFAAVVVAAIGPVRARFTGNVIPQEVVAPSRYALLFEGGSGAAGFAKGQALVTLEPHGPGGEGTRLVWTASSQIGGRLAQIGARLIDATVTRMSQQFFERFEEVLRNPALLDAAPQASAPAAGGSAAPFAAAPQRVAGTVQMPAWVFALAMVLTVLLIGWMAAR